MRLLAIVCANGLGHFRRTVGVLERLRRRVDPLEIHLVCERWQVARSSDWPELVALQAGGLQLHHDIVAPGIEWHLDADEYSTDRLSAWEERLSRLSELEAVDAVLSDNLSGVLAARPDTILLGSFLWSDTLEMAHPGVASVEAFVTRERALLAEHAPTMLCVGELATPGVLARTCAVRLPWMTEPAGAAPPVDSGRPTVGIATGASAMAGRRLEELARALQGELDAEIAVPEVVGPLPGCVPFRFAAADYAACSVLVCRPGAGALNAGVAHRVPVVCLREPGNDEMRHNAQCAEALGIGVDLGEDPSSEAVVEAVRAALDREAQQQFATRLAARPRGGLERAAEWLAQRIVEQAGDAKSPRRPTPTEPTTRDV